MSSHRFNRDYYENGIRKKISGYQEYKWIPTRSIPEAIDIIKTFDFDTCVDYGCAKGFLVHALRILGKEAYGEDISEYAINNAHPKVCEFLSLPNTKKYDLLIAKDILEHVEENDLPELLSSFTKKADNLFFVIPLGDNNLFRIREYEVDITHVTKKDEEWWMEMFAHCGIKITQFSYSLGSIKEKWAEPYPYGNGFFVGKKI